MHAYTHISTVGQDATNRRDICLEVAIRHDEAGVYAHVRVRVVRDRRTPRWRPFPIETYERYVAWPTLHTVVAAIRDLATKAAVPERLIARFVERLKRDAAE